MDRDSINIQLIKDLVKRILPSFSGGIEPVEEGASTFVYRIVCPREVFYLRILFTGILINVRTLSRSLQKKPVNHYTQHLLRILREDLTNFPSFLH